MTKNCRAALKAARKGDYKKAASLVEYETADYFRVAATVKKVAGEEGFVVFRDLVITAKDPALQKECEPDVSADVSAQVLMYASFLGGTFTIGDLTGGTKLGKDEVLETLYWLMKGGFATERHGGTIESYSYPYVYSSALRFEEVGPGNSRVYTIDFESIDRTRRFNLAVHLLKGLIFGEKQRGGNR